ncbi:GH17201 [Drosophila grimshawi]|uniref:GH17201 n=1 Tax=Drosophila grimshawi TaxID=7222 RepID=B4J1U9_DROGR|nr:GH17201 [Drosophila grimshawi]
MRTDCRPFAKVWIGHKELNGLLDTGASVSLLGHGGANLVKELGLELHKACSTVQTAGGSPHRIMGKIRTAMTYNGITKDVDLFPYHGNNRSNWNGLRPNLNRSLNSV